MSNILVVIGSARKGRVADKVLGYINEDLDKREDVSVTIADLKELNLPFFESEAIPMQPDYVPTNEQVLAWQKLVAENDSVVFITPEYNHTLTAIQKNAIDHLFAEWVSKPVTAVAYGWSGGSLALATLEEVITNVKSDWKPTPTSLAFTKDINVDGSILDDANVRSQIATTLDQIV